MNVKSGTRIPELDGIRAIAIWMVLFLHIFSGYWIDRRALAFLHSFFPSFVLETFWHGWMGVDLFFLLSGFLITGILLDSKIRPNYFRNFYIRRFLRIIPLYFLVVIVWWFCYRGYSQYFRLSLFFGANLARFFQVPVPNGPALLWSLAVEEQFYLLWPAVVHLLDRRKLLLLSSAILVAFPVLRAIYFAKGMDPGLIYFSSFRFDGLAAGAILAIWARTEHFRAGAMLRWIALALLISAPLISLAEALVLSPTQQAVAATALRFTQAYLCFAGFFILVLIYRGTKWTAPLRLSFLQLSGALSYCLYLVHLSVGDLFEFVRSRRHILAFQPASLVFLRGAFIVVISFAIASLTRKFLEQPFLALKDRLTASKRNEPVIESPAVAEAST